MIYQLLKDQPTSIKNEQ